MSNAAINTGALAGGYDAAEHDNRGKLYSPFVDVIKALANADPGRLRKPTLQFRPRWIVPNSSGI